MVSFVVPPSPFLLDQKVFMTLGVLRVAAVVRDAGYPVECFSAEGGVDVSGLFHESCNIIGVTGTTPQAKDILEIADKLPYGPLKVLGGPHATLVNASIKTGSDRARPMLEELEDNFDTLIFGDGELAMLDFVQRTRGQQEGTTSIDADDPKCSLFLKDLETLPFPARDLLNPSDYHYAIDGEPAASLIAQLGCPFNCGFCGGRSSSMLRRIRLRSTKSVIDEITFLYNTQGVKAFMFYDDELNVNPKLLELLTALQDLQCRLGVDFSFRGFIKAELFNESQAHEMASAGFKEILSGFESASPKILEVINKKATVEDNTEVIRLCDKHGIRIKALMSIGHPGESEETVNDTVLWLMSEAPDDFDLSLITPYPGSPYYDRAERQTDGSWLYETRGEVQYQRDVDFHHDAYFYKGIPGEYDSTVWTKHLTATRLVELRDQSESVARKILQLPELTPVKAAFESSMGQ